MNASLVRTLAILSAIFIGTLVPQLHVGSWAVRWLIMGMLFLVFLPVKLERGSLHRSHLWLLLANIGMGFLGYGVGWLVGGREVALAGFFAGITPTATAAPVIMSFLRGRVDYVVAAFLLTNVIIAALLPGLLPLVLGQATPDVFAKVGGSVALVVFVPIALALLTRRLHPAARAWPGKLRDVSFGAWVTTMTLITSNASYFVRQHPELPRTALLEIALVSMAICIANFSLGRVLGGREFPREGSQSLGQKNTSFTVYLALTYANPLVALGPTCYVVWHNLWTSWQLHRQRLHDLAAAPTKAP